MADDLVERLRGYLRCFARYGDHQFVGLADDVEEASNALESLRAENARLTEERDALAEAVRVARGILATAIAHEVVQVAGPDCALNEADNPTLIIGEGVMPKIDAAIAKVKGGTDAR